MKRISFIIAAVTMLIGMASCGKSNETLLIGMWGLERLDYYNIDYWGNPIENSMETYEYTPGDFDNGIELVFKGNNRGEWRDHDIDSFFILVSTDPRVYDTIVNPDTTVVTPFTYSYDNNTSAVFVHTANAETFMLNVRQLDETTFVYTNVYKENEEERATMKRINESSTRSSSPTLMKKNGSHRRRLGSFFSHESLNVEH